MSTRVCGVQRLVYHVAVVVFGLLLILSLLPTLVATWSDAETRLTTYLEFDGVPAIIETDDGTIWIFWTRKYMTKYNIFYVTSSTEGATWSTETPLVTSTGADSGVSACQTANGALWLVWASDRTGDHEIFYKTSPNYGATWSNDTQLTYHPGRDLKPTICQMSNGIVWIAWASDRSGGCDLYLKTSSDYGASWSADIRLTTHSSLDRMPTLVQLSNGMIWLGWASDRTGNYDLYYKTSLDLGTSWSSDVQLTSGPKVDSNPCVLQTLDGKLWVFFTKREPADVETSTDDVYYLYSSDAGTTWSDGLQFTSDKYDDIWPSVTQTHLTRIWVVWTSDRADQPDWGNYDLYYRTSLVGDVNGDGAVNVLDLSRVSIAFGSFEGDPSYDPEADINVDGIVDMKDLSLVARNLGAT